MATTSTRIVPSKPHFFKPLLPGFHHGLMIPISFFKYLNVENCDHAVLRTSCGKWEVKIDGDGCGRRFEDAGWRDFANSHDLQVGDFLVFRHEGDMVFDVAVFDPSACEREYQALDVVVGEKGEADSRDDEQESLESESPKDISRADKIFKACRPKGGGGAGAASSTPSHPSFMSTLKPYSFEESRFYIPLSFARSQGLINRSCEMIIKDDDQQQQRTWEVRLRQKSDGQVYIGKGWRDFRIANGLKRGDTLCFELTGKGTKPVLVFHGLKGNSRAKMVHAKMKKSSTTTKLELLYFIATLTRDNLKKAELYIPVKFAKLNGISKYNKMTLKDPKQRDWPLYLRRQKRSDRIYISRGWREFVAANHLKVGDVIKLGLVKAGKKNSLVMNFSFYGGLCGRRGLSSGSKNEYHEV